MMYCNNWGNIVFEQFIKQSIIISKSLFIGQFLNTIRINSCPINRCPQTLNPQFPEQLYILCICVIKIDCCMTGVMYIIFNFIMAFSWCIFIPRLRHIEDSQPLTTNIICSFRLTCTDGTSP